jgi:hypothetical protein
MIEAPTSVGILLVDDGELDGVARLLEQQGIAFERRRGARIPEELAPPRDLLIVTPRRVDRVRRGSPPDAAPGRPLRVIAVDEDSPAMRRRLRRAGLHLLVRLPAQDEIWRLLVARARYRGRERRETARVAVGSPVEMPALSPGAATSDRTSSTILIDLSNRGCRLRTDHPLSIGDAVAFEIPIEEGDGGTEGPMLPLRGRVRRLVRDARSGERTLAIVFDPDLPDATRTGLAALINRWASGPRSLEPPAAHDVPAIPPCQLPSLPDLTLDDETDPPVRGRGDVHVEVAAGTPQDARAATSGDGHREGPQQGSERRRRPRGRFESAFLAEAPGGPVVMIGRDLSAGGMRIERIEEFELGDRFRLALHGPGPTEPFVVQAEVTRDDGADGFALAFHDVDRETAVALEKLVACLPDVESLEDGELGGLGAILSEIMSA